MKQFSPLLLFFFIASSFIKAGGDDVDFLGLSTVHEDSASSNAPFSEKERAAMAAARKAYLQNYRQRSRSISLRGVPVAELSSKNPIRSIRDSMITSERADYYITKNSRNGGQSFCLNLSASLEPEIYTKMPSRTIWRGCIQHHVTDDSYAQTLQKQTTSILEACPLSSLSNEELKQKLDAELTKIKKYKATWESNPDAFNVLMHMISGCSLSLKQNKIFLALYALEKDSQQRPNPFFAEELYKEIEKRESKEKR